MCCGLCGYELCGVGVWCCFGVDVCFMLVFVFDVKCLGRLVCGWDVMCVVVCWKVWLSCVEVVWFGVN